MEKFSETVVSLFQCSFADQKDKQTKNDLKYIYTSRDSSETLSHTFSNGVF